MNKFDKILDGMQKLITTAIGVFVFLLLALAFFILLKYALTQ